MSKMSDKDIERKYGIEQGLEQSIDVGDIVLVADSQFYGEKKKGTVISKRDKDGTVVVDVDGRLIQVCDIQCFKLGEKAPRVLYVEFNGESIEAFHSIEPEKMNGAHQLVKFVEEKGK